jgi:hypothetical protein
MDEKKMQKEMDKRWIEHRAFRSQYDRKMLSLQNERATTALHAQFVM